MSRNPPSTNSRVAVPSPVCEERGERAVPAELRGEFVRHHAGPVLQEEALSGQCLLPISSLLTSPPLPANGESIDGKLSQHVGFLFRRGKRRAECSSGRCTRAAF